MKFAIDSFSYHLHFGKHWFTPTHPVDLKWYCETSKKLGAKGIHVDPFHIDLDKDTEWLSEYLAANNMYIELGGAGVDIETLKPQLLTAQKLGSPILRTFIDGDCSKGRAYTKQNALKAKELLKESVKLAEDLNVIIAVEDHIDLFLDDMLILMEIDSPCLGTCYDSGNYMAVGEDPLNALEKLIDRVVCTHLKDMCQTNRYTDAETFGINNHKGHFCAIGDGILPAKKITDILKEKKGNDLKLTLEIHTPYRKSLSEKDLLDFEINNIVRSVNYLTAQLF